MDTRPVRNRHAHQNHRQHKTQYRGRGAGQQQLDAALALLRLHPEYAVCAQQKQGGSNCGKRKSACERHDQNGLPVGKLLEVGNSINRLGAQNGFMLRILCIAQELVHSFLIPLAKLRISKSVLHDRCRENQAHEDGKDRAAGDE